MKSVTGNQNVTLFADQEVPQAITLLDFNRLVKGLLLNSSVMQRWVIAETSDVSLNRGHCYMELVQKNESGITVAKAHAVIWASAFRSLGRKFLEATGQAFGSGMKVMVKVSANFHEQYGLSLVVSDINPEFTMGDMARKRIEILNRLKREGVIDLNRQMAMPAMPQRIAVVSSAGAAGYGDFMNQLAANACGVKFYTCLFAATMQGTNTVPTVLSALDRIEEHKQLFDCVVIIRGGGSTTDLNWFDDYSLAARVARFPLPVITGIGHERDNTVLDYVSHLRVKTPTAAAEFFVNCGTEAIARLNELKEQIATTVRDSLSRCNQQLAYYTGTIPMLTRHIMQTNGLRLQSHIDKIPLHVRSRIDSALAMLSRHTDRVRSACRQVALREQMRLKALGDKVEILSPRNTLNRGYSLTMCRGRYVTDATQLQAGDVVTSHLKNGRVRSVVTDK